MIKVNSVRLDLHLRKINDAAARARSKVLGRQAGAVRLTARRSIRRRKKPSPRGRPPHTQTGNLRRSILYAVLDEYSAVIGPAGLGSKSSSVGPSATAHEFGGEFRGDHYPQRPFMGPALAKITPKLPEHWRDAIQ